MDVDVFISYARSESRDQARSIAAALKNRGISVFLDEKEIPHGQRFPVEVSEAMRKARIVLILLSEAYLEKPWCAFELRISLAPYRRVRAEAPPDHIVFGLPDKGGLQTILPHLPPRLAQTNWPKNSDTAQLTELIMARLPYCIQNLGKLLEDLDPRLLDSLGSGGEIPIAGRPGLLAGWFNDLPQSLNERFHGREAELWSLFHLLQIGEVTEGTRSCVISGGAGMGKTQLAAEFVHRYGPLYYRGGVVWIDAAHNERIASPPWREILRGLGVTESPLEATDKWALDELAPAIRRRVTEGPVLWVVDNLPEISLRESAPSLVRWCPVQSLVTLICTSRQPGIAGCDARIELSETDVDDAILILTDGGVVRGQLEERQWKDIVRWVGGLPLALRIMNASLVEGFCTPAELHSASQSTNAVEHLDGEFETLLSEVPAGSLRGLSMAFNISLESLRSNEATLAAAFRIARLAPVPIPGPLLANIADRRILGQLKSRHWLLGDAERHNDEARGRWRMHRLTASYLRSRSIDPLRELSDLAKSMTAALLHPESLRQIPSSRLLSHILKVLSDLAQAGIDNLRPETLAAARDLILAGTFFRLEEEESDDLRTWAASFAVRFGVDGAIVEQLEALFTDRVPNRWLRLLPIVRSLTASRASARLLLRLLQENLSNVQHAALWIAGFHEAQDELAIPSLDALLSCFPQGALFTASPLETDIMKYLGTPDPLWELPTSQDTRDLLESLSRKDRLPAMIEVVKHRLRGTQTREELERLLDAYVLCLRAHYTPLPYRTYSAGRWDPIEETSLGGYSEFHMPSARKVDADDFQPLVELMLTSSDEVTVRRTVRLLATFVAGTNSLSQAVHSALDAGRPVRALLLADQTIEVRKDYVNGWWWRALALDEMGQEKLLGDALSAYGRVVNLEPKFVDARVRHATLALKLGDFDRGLRSARVLAKLQPGNGLAYHLQACALLNLNRPKEAVDAASEAVRLAPKESEAWLFQALAYEQLNVLEKARTAAQRAADLDPEDPRARECLDRLG